MNLSEILLLSNSDFNKLVSRLSKLRESKITLAIPTREVKRKSPLPVTAGKWERKLVAHWEANNSRLCLRMGKHITTKYRTREAYAKHLCKKEGIA